MNKVQVLAVAHTFCVVLGSLSTFEDILNASQHWNQTSKQKNALHVACTDVIQNIIQMEMYCLVFLFMKSGPTW
jgi:hypothetical protein